MPLRRLRLIYLIAACVALPFSAIAQTGHAPHAKPKIERGQAGSHEQYRPGDIVCTKAGRRPLPPNCHAVNEENWEGPTGYAIIICP